MGRDSFEIYAFKDGNWSADSVHEKKNLAISLALTLLNKTDKTAVRVVKKTSGLPNNQVQAVIIFKDSSEDIRVSDKAWDDSVRKKKEARLKKLAEKVMEKKKADGEKTMKLNMRIIKMSFITGTTLGVLIGWVYYVLDYFGKL
ncbi:MAG: hypothetical protein QF511_10380 [Rhodospirillales bacterium]|jgi:acid phosphatase family membrane protein YuiD|nr:hypothetical protein [Rhodospirillales bacterium]HIJ43242.1 hypothetical protein [Rhodospirillaceae bacterium]MDP7215026.1 hypothetical protein [Rhodospirillales bacterium]HIJ45382.1 hypothetical protein [Rhodospirillaceae bacterium]HIJ92373.1 hypothetical protein [Rhodospirillaceae bacterium]